LYRYRDLHKQAKRQIMKRRALMKPPLRYVLRCGHPASPIEAAGLQNDCGHAISQHQFPKSLNTLQAINPIPAPRVGYF